ncbi:MAG: elongation factor G [Acholeplasmataceae bacterium]|mgnify:CR=1 FL=1|jgi:elongation factor G|nr:elongation factor G [Acholeplasmataceae bacterium]MDD4203921.1 elongation factor G [Acholeplasmataceae bacterium]MDD4824559.1 elongation factor G [Acholeplasmataceae bacterium]
MRVYQTNQIRNIALLGHLGSGKTTIAESLLFVSGGLTSKGTIENKNTVSDYMDEEKIKQGSLSTSLIPIEWADMKLNFLDVPGTEELDNEIKQVLNIVKGAILVVDGTKGVEIGTLRLWKQLTAAHVPTVIFVNKMDKENIKFDTVIDDIRNKLGKQAIPFLWPIGKEADFEGFVNCVEMKAFVFDDKGTKKEVEIWEEKRDKIDSVREMLLESVAETSEDLLEKYFGGEEISQEEINQGLQHGIKNGELIPILLGSATKNIGISNMLDMLIEFLPKPEDLKPLKGINPKSDEAVKRQTLSSEPFSGFVFKTMIDPFVGAINLIKVNSGSIKTGQEIYIGNTGKTEKIGALFTMVGKKQVPLDEVVAGDICAVSKLDDIHTNFTISDPKNPIVYPDVKILKPTIYIAITPKNRQDEDKISNALNRLNIEDPSFETIRNKETNQLLLGGLGMTHINYVIDRMRNVFKVEVTQEESKVVYRETIKKRVEAEGKHKKQSGGAGQFGHVWIRFEPSTEIFEFHEEVFGGAVPKNYFPAVEKGLLETFEHGPLAGFPVINVKSTLYDGSYHPVDSNEISFKLAASLAFKKAVETAGPTILEPILKLTITVNEQYVGDVMGDMNKRRGRVLGMLQSHEGHIVEAEAPESEVLSYAIDLKAMTQGSGSFQREFLRYEEVPAHLIPGIIEKYKA